MTIGKAQKNHIQLMLGHLFGHLWDGKNIEEQDGQVPPELNRAALTQSMQEIAEALNLEKKSDHPEYAILHDFLHHPEHFRDIEHMDSRKDLTNGEVRLYMVEYIDRLIKTAADKLIQDRPDVPRERILTDIGTGAWEAHIATLKGDIARMPDHGNPVITPEQKDEEMLDEHQLAGRAMGLSHENIHANHFGSHTIDALTILRQRHPGLDSQTLFRDIAGLNTLQTRGIVHYGMNWGHVSDSDFGEHTLDGIDARRRRYPNVPIEAHINVMTGLDKAQVAGMITHDLTRDQVTAENFGQATLDAMAPSASRSQGYSYDQLEHLSLDGHRALAYYGLSLEEVDSINIRHRRKYTMRTMLDAIDRQRPEMMVNMSPAEKIALNYRTCHQLQGYDYHQLWGMAYANLSPADVQQPDYHARRRAMVAASKVQITKNLSHEQERALRHSIYSSTLGMSPEKLETMARYGISMAHSQWPQEKLHTLLQAINTLSAPEINEGHSPTQANRIMRRNYGLLDQYLNHPVNQRDDNALTKITGAIMQYGFLTEDFVSQHPQIVNSYIAAMGTLSRQYASAGHPAVDIHASRVRLQHLYGMHFAQVVLIAYKHFTVVEALHHDAGLYGDAMNILVPTVNGHDPYEAHRAASAKISTMSRETLVAIAYHGMNPDTVIPAGMTPSQFMARTRYGFTDEEARADHAILHMDAINAAMLLKASLTNSQDPQHLINASRGMVASLSDDDKRSLAYYGVLQTLYPHVTMDIIDHYTREEIEPGQSRQTVIDIRRNSFHLLKDLHPLQLEAVVYFYMPLEETRDPDNLTHIQAVFNLIADRITEPLGNLDNVRQFKICYQQVQQIPPQPLHYIANDHFSLQEALNPDADYLAQAIERHIATLPVDQPDEARRKQAINEYRTLNVTGQKAFVSYGMTMNSARSISVSTHMQAIDKLLGSQLDARTEPEKLMLRHATYQATAMFDHSQHEAILHYNLTLEQVTHPQFGLNVDALKKRMVFYLQQNPAPVPYRELYRAITDDSIDYNQAIAYFGYGAHFSPDDGLDMYTRTQQCAIVNYGMSAEDARRADITSILHLLNRGLQGEIGQSASTHYNSLVTSYHRAQWQKLKDQTLPMLAQNGLNLEMLAKFDVSPAQLLSYAPEALDYVLSLTPEHQKPRNDTMGTRTIWLAHLDPFTKETQQAIARYQLSLPELKTKDLPHYFMAADHLRAKGNPQTPPRRFFNEARKIDPYQIRFMKDTGASLDEAMQSTGEHLMAAYTLAGRMLRPTMSAQERNIILMRAVETLKPLKPYQHIAIGHYLFRFEEVTDPAFTETVFGHIERRAARTGSSRDAYNAWANAKRDRAQTPSVAVASSSHQR